MQQYSRGPLTFDVDDSGPADGPVMVLLHGFPENRTSWWGVTPHLVDAGFRVLAPDQRGYSPGARPPRRRDYVLSELVDDVIALIDAAGAERVHVVGHDWGGAVAWGLAQMRPERLLSMTSLTTPHPSALTRSLLTSTQALRSYYMALMQLPGLPELAISARGGANFKRGLIDSGLAPDAAERYAAPMRDKSAARGGVNWYRGLPLSRVKAERIREVPVLYVYATKDRVLGRAAADLTGNYVDGPYRYEVVEGASHWLPEEAPETVAKLLIEHAQTRN
jgi:pimeloyl-ACP methyl ester carboxylesterase